MRIATKGTFCRAQVSCAAHFAVLLTMAMLAGCKPVGPNYNRPAYQVPAAFKESGSSTMVMEPPSPSGGGWKTASPADEKRRGKWWEIYQDSQLNKLEERISSTNQTLRQATESYLAARDQVTATRASLYPKFSVGPSIARDNVSQNGPSYSPGKDTAYNDFVLSGHVHDYVRTHPINQGRRVGSPAEGTVYLVTVSVPSRPGTMSKPDYAAVAEHPGLPLYQVFKINGKRLVTQSCDLDGKTRDEFVVEK